MRVCVGIFMWPLHVLIIFHPRSISLDFANNTNRKGNFGKKVILSFDFDKEQSTKTPIYKKELSCWCQNLIYKIPGRCHLDTPLFGSCFSSLFSFFSLSSTHRHRHRLLDKENKKNNKD